MNEKIRQHLSEYATSNNWQTDDGTLFEIIREAKRVYSVKIGSHRWYDDVFIVVDVNGMKIGYNDFYMTGDNSPSDMGLEYDIDSICEVRPVEKTVTVYEKVNPVVKGDVLNTMITDPKEATQEEVKEPQAAEETTEATQEATTEETE
ncbi:MAG TPA: hypothetical protein VF008_09825 [Niastella sp.]